MELKDSINTELTEANLDYNDVPKLVQHMIKLLHEIENQHNDREDYDHLALQVLEYAIILSHPADADIEHEEKAPEVQPEVEKHAYAVAAEKLPHFANYKGFLTKEEIETISLPTYETLSEARENIAENQEADIIKVNWETGEFYVVAQIT